MTFHSDYTVFYCKLSGAIALAYLLDAFQIMVEYLPENSSITSLCPVA